MTFNAKKNLTTAFVAMHSHINIGDLSQIVAAMKISAAQSAHPLYLPATLISATINGLFRDVGGYQRELYKVQSFTGLVDVSWVFQGEQVLETDTAYKELVALHDSLAITLYDFSVKFVEALVESLIEFEECAPNAINLALRHQTDAVRSYIRICHGTLDGVIMYRNRMRELIEMQLKAVCCSSIINVCKITDESIPAAISSYANQRYPVDNPTRQ